MSDDDDGVPLGKWFASNANEGKAMLHWYCEPPPLGASYEVIREKPGRPERLSLRHPIYPVREIYEIRVH